jgi:hypothetical protein
MPAPCLGALELSGDPHSDFCQHRPVLLDRQLVLGGAL